MLSRAYWFVEWLNSTLQIQLTVRIEAIRRKNKLIGCYGVRTSFAPLNILWWYHQINKSKTSEFWKRNFPSIFNLSTIFIKIISFIRLKFLQKHLRYATNGYPKTWISLIKLNGIKLIFPNSRMGWETFCFSLTSRIYTYEWEIESNFMSESILNVSILFNLNKLSLCVQKLSHHLWAASLCLSSQLKTIYSTNSKDIDASQTYCHFTVTFHCRYRDPMNKKWNR